MKSHGITQAGPVSVPSTPLAVLHSATRVASHPGRNSLVYSFGDSFVQDFCITTEGLWRTSRYVVKFSGVRDPGDALVLKQQ
jgi:hypothetical protein